MATMTTPKAAQASTATPATASGLLRAAGSGALALLATSIVARLPLAMFSIGLLVHVHHLTGSFAVAGLVSGSYIVARGIGSPVLGRLVDRYGQTAVLAGAAGASAVLLASIALAPAGTPAFLLVLLAGAVGLVSPPLGACARALMPMVISDPAGLPAAYTFETTALELTFILGPPLALALGAAWSTGGALISSGLLLFGGTVAFAAQPASRAWRPEREHRPDRGSSLRSPTIRTLILILVAIGAVFGAVEVAVVAAASSPGKAGATGPLLGLWGLGSLAGGIVATRAGGAGTEPRRVIVLITALAFGHAALILTTGSVVAMGAVLFLAGTAISPTTGSIYALAGRAAPPGARTEAFAWLLTANATGASLGSAAAGSLIQAGGALAAFGLAGLAGAAAVLAVAFGRRGLRADQPPRAASTTAWASSRIRSRWASPSKLSA